MSISTRARRHRPPVLRVLLLALTLLIGVSSVEILWAETEPSPETQGSVATQDARPLDPEPAEDAPEDCHCLCACECQAVHVVPGALPEPQVGFRAPNVPEPVVVEAAPPGPGAEPPFRPPRQSSSS